MCNEAQASIFRENKVITEKHAGGAKPDEASKNKYRLSVSDVLLREKIQT